MVAVLGIVILVDIALYIKRKKNKPAKGKIAVTEGGEDSLNIINLFDDDGDGDPHTTIYKFDNKTHHPDVTFVRAPLVSEYRP